MDQWLMRVEGALAAHFKQENGASRPRCAGSAAHSRWCRYDGSSESSDGHGHWMPPSSSRRRYDMPACIGER